MRRTLVPSSGFSRALRRWLKKHPDAEASLDVIFSTMSENVFTASLGTHKLKGKWASYYACSTGYDSRIIFEFFELNGAEAIQLVTFGTHEEVYRPPRPV